MEIIWLVKLMLAHLLTDFILQPASWTVERNQRHAASAKLYLHGLITAAVAYILIGWSYWAVALIILVTHIAIDLWKSYRAPTVQYFLIDQALHLLVLAGCWYITFLPQDIIQAAWKKIDHHGDIWLFIVAMVFVTTPAGILIAQLTKHWRDRLDDAQQSRDISEFSYRRGASALVDFLVAQRNYDAIQLAYRQSLAAYLTAIEQLREAVGSRSLP